jgi:APA family basic amino acid/polyamine antiporter
MTDVSTNPYRPADDAADAAASPGSPAPARRGARLSRALGPAMAIAVVVGNVIGSGIFLKPGTIAMDGGRFDLIIAVWIAGGVLCILGALCFAELATMLPRAGGMYVYLREAYGRPTAFLFGWTEFLIRAPGSIAALSVVFIGQLLYVLGWKVSPALEVVFVALVIAALAGVNMLGVLWGGWTQLGTTIIKAAVLALVALIPLLALPFVSGFNVANYATTVEPKPLTLSAQLAAVLIAVMWAYNGWHGITPLAEEVRRPRRNMPLALFGGIGILIVLYLGANLAYHGVLTMEEVKAVGVKNAAEGGQLVKSTAAAEMLERLLGPAGGMLIAGAIICSTFGAINSNLLEVPRITFAMGRDGVFFRGLGQVHATFRTPVAAIVVTAAMTVGLVVITAVAKHLARGVNAEQLEWEFGRRVTESLQQGTMFNLLTDCVIFAASVFYTLAVLAVIVLRFRRPDLRRPYRTLGYPFVPALFIVVYGWFLWRILIDKPLEALAGLAVIAVGLPVYFAYQAWSRGAEEKSP